VSAELSFFIPCLPPKATAQQKGVFIAGGKPRFFKKKAQQQAENSFLALFQPHRPIHPIEGPLDLSVVLSFPWRKSEKKSIRKSFTTMPISTRPDLDNLFKAIADVMGTLGFWLDDGQISTLVLKKQYSNHPGIAVVLRRAQVVTDCMELVDAPL